MDDEQIEEATNLARALMRATLHGPVPIETVMTIASALVASGARDAKRQRVIAELFGLGADDSE